MRWFPRLSPITTNTSMMMVMVLETSRSSL
jgi:hypothetical protein